MSSGLRKALFVPYQDAWSDGEGHVSLDSQQDYQLIEAKQKPDGYHLLFKRRFSTCDPRDYLIEVWSTFAVFVCVCWSLSRSSDGRSGADVKAPRDGGHYFSIRSSFVSAFHFSITLSCRNPNLSPPLLAHPAPPASLG